MKMKLMAMAVLLSVGAYVGSGVNASFDVIDHEYSAKYVGTEDVAVSRSRGINVGDKMMFFKKNDKVIFSLVVADALQ